MRHVPICAGMIGTVWWVYFIRCRGGEVYTGICTDVSRRFAEHQSGGAKAAKFLRGRGPLELLASRSVGARSRALRVEAWIKKMPRSDKLALVFDPAILDQLIRQFDSR